MTKIMNASESMTDGQIDTAVNQFRDAMRKNRDGVGKELAQQVLGVDNLGMRMFAVYRDLAEKFGKTITRHVVVDRSLTPEQMINLTGRVKWFIDPEVLVEMPREGLSECAVEIFELDYDASVDQLDNEYESNSRAQDPYAVIQMMIDDPSLADERPIAVQWRDKRGRACYAIFDRHGDGERRVRVSWDDDGWDRNDRFAGSRK